MCPYASLWVLMGPYMFFCLMDSKGSLCVFIALFASL